MYSWLSTAKKLSIDCPGAGGKEWGRWLVEDLETCTGAEKIAISVDLTSATLSRVLKMQETLKFSFVLCSSLCVCIPHVHLTYSGELCAHLLACTALQRIN